MALNRIELGDRAKCKITGIAGIVTVISHWLNGCVRFGIQPEKPDDKGNRVDLLMLDEGDAALVKKAVHPPVVLRPALAPEPPPRGPGGPAREPRGFRR